MTTPPNDDANNPILLTSFANEAEAAMLIAYLQDQGIPAQMTGQLTSGFRAESVGYVRVIVSHDDYPKAQLLLEQFKQDKPHIDWSQVDVGEMEEGAPGSPSEDVTPE